MTAFKLVPIGVVAVVGLMLVAMAVPSSVSSDEMDLAVVGRFPVQYQGRIMPLDTVARHHLLIISGGRQTYATGQKGAFGPKSAPAIQWLLEVMSGSEAVDGLKFIRIDDPALRQYLQLEKRPGSYRYSPTEIEEKLDRHRTEVKKIVDKAKADIPPTEFEASLLATRGHLQTVASLRAFAFPGMVPDPDNPTLWLSLGQLDEQLIPQFRMQAMVEGAAVINKGLADLGADAERKRQEFGAKAFDARVDQAKLEAAFKRLRELIAEHRKDFSPQSAAFHRILDAYAAGTAGPFNDAVREYKEQFVSKYDKADVGRASMEHFLNRFDPFFLCRWLYIVVMVLAALSWLVWSKPLNNAAAALGCLTLLVHTGAVVLRVVISEKPPVTNLYSSAVFIGWGCLILCLGLDFYYRNGIGNFVGGLTGMATMLIAQFLESNGDTMPRVEAVLNTNFWLASHVTLVTLGYTATYVAGMLGAVYLLAGLFSNALAPDKGRKLYSMTYGVTCFATLLSFVGTVLGGFWADDSWGRFWGWDPKENGAVLIVIWNTLNLHLRWGGLVKGRGFAIVAVLGNVVTTWSWFGTNQLGIGLHAYGFDSKLAEGCKFFWISQFFIVALGLVPLKYWSSFGPTAPVRGGRA